MKAFGFYFWYIKTFNVYFYTYLRANFVIWPQALVVESGYGFYDCVVEEWLESRGGGGGTFNFNHDHVL